MATKRAKEVLGAVERSVVLGLGEEVVTPY